MPVIVLERLSLTRRLRRRVRAELRHIVPFRNLFAFRQNKASRSSGRRAKGHRGGRNVAFSLGNRSRRVSGVVFAELQFLFVLGDNTATTADAFETIARDISGLCAHAERLSDA